MGIILIPLLELLNDIIGLYKFLIIVYIIMSWLEALNIVNSYNQIVYTISMVLFKLVDPVLRRIRAVIPSIGMLDLSPLVLFFIIYFIQGVISQLSIKLRLMGV